MKPSWLQTESQCWGQEKSRLPQWNEKLITKKDLSAPFLEKMLCLHCWELSSIVRKQIVMWWWYFTWVPWTWQASGTFDGRQADGQRALDKGFLSLGDFGELDLFTSSQIIHSSAIQYGFIYTINLIYPIFFPAHPTDPAQQCTEIEAFLIFKVILSLKDFSKYHSNIIGKVTERTSKTLCQKKFIQTFLPMSTIFAFQYFTIVFQLQ